MKIKNVVFVAVVVIASAAELLIAQPAWAAVDPADVNQIFTGTYRAPAKTSVAKSAAPLKKYPDLSTLLQSLPKDSAMRAKYPALRKTAKKWPQQRELEEMVNVRIDACWICAVSYEHGVKGDNDFHVILSDSPAPPFTKVMNAEVAGLPETGPDVSRLKAVRKKFLSFFLHTPQPGGFLPPSKPLHVRVEGSLFFDGHHGAGGKSDPGPSWAKPKTVWEVHPIYKLTRLD
jgi:hypothetical protein